VPTFSPLPLRRLREPFDDPEWFYELKYDGFRALAYLAPAGAQLVSRNGNHFSRFAPLAAALQETLRVRSTVLDGEVVCLDKEGRPQFNELLFGRGVPVFVAFDVLEVNGRDVRGEVLTARKARLRRMLGGASGAVLYAQHVAGEGRALFERVCAEDLEGIVAKWGRGTYTEPSSWVKVKNRSYTGARDRHELMR
jgi:bifunctional non-homologous end joining protein LigD